MCNERVITFDNTSVTEAITGSQGSAPIFSLGAFFPSAVCSTNPWHQWVCVGLWRESTSIQMLTTTCISNFRGSDALFRTSETVALVGTYPPILHICIHTQHYVHMPTCSYIYTCHIYTHITALMCTYPLTPTHIHTYTALCAHLFLHSCAHIYHPTHIHIIKNKISFKKLK